MKQKPNWMDVAGIASAIVAGITLTLLVVSLG